MKKNIRITSFADDDSNRNKDRPVRPWNIRYKIADRKQQNNSKRAHVM